CAEVAGMIRHPPAGLRGVEDFAPVRRQPEERHPFGKVQRPGGAAVATVGQEASRLLIVEPDQPVGGARRDRGGGQPGGQENDHPHHDGTSATRCPTCTISTSSPLNSNSSSGPNTHGSAIPETRRDVEFPGPLSLPRPSSTDPTGGGQPESQGRGSAPLA